LDPSIPLSVKPIQLPDPLEVFSAIEQVKGQREAAELRRLAAEEARQRGIEAREERAEKKQLAELYADAVTVDPVNGQITYNRDTLIATATQRGYKHLVPTLLDQLEQDEVRMNTLIKSGLDLDHARRVWLAEEAPDVIDAQGDPEVWKTTLLRARQTNSIDQATYDREVARTDPQEILARAQAWVTRAAGDKKPTLMNVPSGGVIFDPVTRQPVYTNERSAGANAAVGSIEDYILRTYGATPTPAQVLQAKKDFGQADDRPLQGTDPVLHQLRQLQLDQALQAAKSGGNYSPAQIARFNAIAAQYDRSPLVRASDRTIILKDAAKAVRADPKNAANQLSLAYSFIQAMDTYQSAVREGELQNLGVLGTRLQQLALEANRVATSGAFLPPAVALEIATSADQLIKTIDAGRAQKERQFRSQANVSGIAPMWDQFTSGFQTPPAGTSTPETPGAPARVQPPAAGGTRQAPSTNPFRK
jgi:hypothetical protein